MPTTVNPFLDDPAKAEVFEQGLIAGFNDPNGSDFRPFVPDLLAAFQQGFQDGRSDLSEGPLDSLLKWVERTGLSELLEHVVMFKVFHLIDKIFKDFSGAEVTAIPLIDLVILALQIPGDTALKELPADFRADFNREENNPAIHYMALCPRSDHARVSTGVTADGYFVGPDRRSMEDAIEDMNAHDHAEALVVRCSLDDDTCGPVWLAVPKTE